MSGARAWVITQEGTEVPCEVIAVISARRSEEFIKHTLELLCGLLHYSPAEQLAAARWNRPVIPFTAEPTEQGHRTAFHCGPNPFLVARLARKVNLEGTPKAPTLAWQEPDRFVGTASGPRRRAVGRMCSAPVRLIWQHQR